MDKIIRLYLAFKALEKTPEWQELKAALEDLGVDF